MKTTIYLLALSLFYCSCNVFSDNKRNTEPLQPHSSPAPAKLDPKEFNYYSQILDIFFQKHLLNKGFNGDILIAKKGNIVYEKYVGYADLRKKDTLTDSTSIHIASAGKTFTGVAILQLVQERKLSLNDSLSGFFPGIPYPGITLKMLLNHRSGLPNYVYFIPNDNYWDTSSANSGRSKYVTNNDVLNLLYTNQPKPTFPPNTHFSYSNTNFVLLAMIVEKISGKPFPQYMKEKFFDPLQMKNTYVFTLADSLKATPSFNYDRRYWQYDFLEGTYGDKNIYTTPRDMLKWDQALYTDRILNKDLRDSAFTPYSLERPSIHNYGLGWRLLLLRNGKKVIYHFGRWHGFNAAFARLTEDSATIIILGNKFNRSIYTSAHKAYDLFGDYQQQQNGEEEENDNAESSSKTKITSPHIKKYRRRR